MDYTSFAPGASAQQPIPPKLEPALPPPHKRHLPKFAAVIILIVLLGGTAYGSLWWWNQIKVADQEVPVFTPRVTQTNSSDISILITTPTASMGTLAGQVNIGPNCPVEQAGNPCTPFPQAYTSRQVMIYKADGTTLMTTQNFDTKGNYNITLPVGTYVVKSRTGINLTAQTVGTVTVQNGQTATLNFNIDTGIR